MKKRVVVSLLLAVAMMVCFSMPIFSAEDTNAPVLNVEAKNVAFEDSVYLVYLVSYEHVAEANVRLLVWNAPRADGVYEYGTQSDVLTASDSMTYNNKSCLMFVYKKLGAKEMADNIYVRPYAEKNDTGYYGDLLKYSVVQYAYDINAKSTNEGLKLLLGAMLDYGAAAQTYFGYNIARPANADFYAVSVVGGTLNDGLQSGLYSAGEKIGLHAPASNASGQIFTHWQNSAGEVLSQDCSFEAVAVGANETYTAVYTDAFVFTEQNDGSYSISLKNAGSASGTVVIPNTYLGAPVTKIESECFRNCTSMTSVYIPANVTYMGSGAFSGCTELADAHLAVSDGWIAGYIAILSSSLKKPDVAADHLSDRYADVEWKYSPQSGGDYTYPY